MKNPIQQSATPALIRGWGAALGSAVVSAEKVAQEFGLPAGKLRRGAGLESVARASAGENEASLGMAASNAALGVAGAAAAGLDRIVATSETWLGYPSLGAQMHSRLLVRETCGVLDVGGACLGLLNAFAAAEALISSGAARRILVVTADVHSRGLTPGRVKGEFGTLFGDGASAFVLEAGAAGGAFVLGEFFFGCAGAHAGAIRVGPTASGEIDLHFDGEALSRAAVSRMERLIEDVELRSGLRREDAAAFATHQPNPRLVALLGRQAGVAVEKFPAVAKTCGNLGSSTCGVALCRALAQQAELPSSQRGPIFLASLGPGLLWGAGLVRAGTAGSPS